jgi:hypothetical protein
MSLLGLRLRRKLSLALFADARGSFPGMAMSSGCLRARVFMCGFLTLSAPDPTDPESAGSEPQVAGQTAAVAQPPPTTLGDHDRESRGVRSGDSAVPALPV